MIKHHPEKEVITYENLNKKVAGSVQQKFWRMYPILLIILLTLLMMNCRFTFAEAPKPVTNFEARTFHDSQGGNLPYRLLKPLSDNGMTQYPLVLFLHGSGERGSDNNKQLNYIVQIFEQPDIRQKYPCFVVAPQCPSDQNWVVKESYSGTVSQSPEPAKPLKQTVELLGRLEKEFPVDINRIYIIGLSSGASGVWDLLARYPEMFAAASPFSGSGDDQKAYLMVKIPIWAFHGGRDILVNPNTTRLMIEAIRKAGGHPKYTEYPNLFHNTWNKTFHDPQFFEWLFSQKRN
jgi:predicted peptidase